MSSASASASSSSSIAMTTLPATNTSPISGVGTSILTSPSPFTSTSRPPPRLLQTRVAVSSLPLQMLLYYHALFSLTFGVMFLWIFPWKYLNSSDIRTAVISPIVFTLWSIVEIIRIYMGYCGNCKEQVPHLVAFLFLTLFPQVFITIYFMLMQKPLLPMDRILSIIQLILLAVNVLLGGLAFRTIVQNKTARFAVEFGEIAGAAQTQTQTESTRAILSAPSSSDDDDFRTSRHQHIMLRERGGTSAESRLATTTLLSSALSSPSPSGHLSESEQERAERRARDRALIRQQYKPTRLTAERRQYYQQLESELGSTAGVFDSSPSPHQQGPIRTAARRSIEMSRASMPSIRASDLVQESAQDDDGMETDTSVGTEDELLRARRSR